MGSEAPDLEDRVSFVLWSLTMTFVALVVLGAMLVGVVLVVHGTLAKNRWGINLDQVRCARCGEQLPMVRKPQSVRQALWGGYVCPRCGTELDKWGRELNSNTGKRVTKKKTA